LSKKEGTVMVELTATKLEVGKSVGTLVGLQVGDTLVGF